MSAAYFVSSAIVNLFVLLGFVALCTLARGGIRVRNRKVPVWQVGILFGAMAFVSMLAPVEVKEGLFFDCRSGVVGVGAILGGPWAALVSVVMPCAYRLYLGGIGLVPGILETLLPAALGSLCHLYLRRRDRSLSPRLTVTASLWVGSASGLLLTGFVFLFMPSLLDHVSGLDVLLVTLNTPIVMGVLSAMLVFERQHADAMASISDHERRMLHSQKMAAIGQLAHRIAHGFANSLTTVQGNVFLVRKRANLQPDMCAALDEVLRTTEKMAAVSGELLAFANPGSLRWKRIDLAKCLREIAKRIQNSMSQGVKVTIEADPDTGFVNVDPDRIEQALMHIAVNAAEAMKDQGQLTLRSRRINPSPSERTRLQAGVPEPDRHDGAFALVTLTDTGCGMAPETVLRAFEPFFTTKADHANAGLGLATVYNIIRQHKGFVDIESEPGAGTTVLIYLPVNDAPAPAA